MQVELHPTAAAALRRHALDCLPDEACGLLARTPQEATIELTHFAPLRNTLESPDRFAMDPVAVVRVATEWRGAGLRLGAVFHSHPDGRAVPSGRDEAAAALWPDLVQLILAIEGRAADGARTTGACTAWGFDGGLIPLRLDDRVGQPA